MHLKKQRNKAVPQNFDLNPGTRKRTSIAFNRILSFCSSIFSCRSHLPWYIDTNYTKKFIQVNLSVSLNFKCDSEEKTWKLCCLYYKKISNKYLSGKKLLFRPNKYYYVDSQSFFIWIITKYLIKYHWMFE